jgi:hypothetical protein
MLSWKTLLFAAPVAVSLLAANNAHAELANPGVPCARRY